MYVRFSNLGCVAKAEFELQPLTVIIGPNNSGKTYVAYSVYGLFQVAQRQVRNNLLRIREKDGKFLATLDDATMAALHSNFTQSAARFKDSISEFFQDSTEKLFEQTTIELKLDPIEIHNAIENVIDRGFTFDVFGPPRLEIQTRRINNQIEFSIAPIVDKSAFDAMQVRRYFEFAFIHEINKELFPRCFPMPAERNALVNTYKLLANRRYKLLKDTRRVFILDSEDRHSHRFELLREQGDIRYPQPVEDFLDFLVDLDLQPIRAKGTTKNPYYQLAKLIEEEIQGKNKTTLRATKFGGKEIKVTIRRGLEIDLYNASSSIKQLAPLLLYLRYRAARGDLLVIDEPEMNLHPQSQAKLIEILCILVNLGIRVFITTHSPYLMAHLSNLVSGDPARLGVRRQQARFLLLQDERAFISLDSVGAYEMRDGGLHSLKDDDYGIRWDTLSNVSSEIQQTYFKMYEETEE